MSIEHHAPPHSGNITERPNGRFRAQVMLAGKRICSTHDTRTEANDWIRKTVTDWQKGELNPNAARYTLARYLNQWLATAQPSLRPHTHALYSDMVRLHITPTLGKHRLDRLRADAIQRLLSDKLREGLSPRTVQIIHSVLYRALKAAHKWRLIPHNPSETVTPPRQQRKEIRTWTEEQARCFLAGIQDDRLHPLYHLALATGLRMGELLALHWQDVNLDKGMIQVRRTIQYLPGKGLTESETKTRRAQRQVVLPLATTRLLREHKARQLEERRLLGTPASLYVFSTSTGTPFASRNIYRHFNSHIKRLRLPRLRLHDLRHTAATLMLGRGINPKIVQEMLGHSSITLTLDTYSHVTPTMQEQAALVMNDILDTT